MTGREFIRFEQNLLIVATKVLLEQNLDVTWFVFPSVVLGMNINNANARSRFPKPNFDLRDI